MHALDVKPPPPIFLLRLRSLLFFLRHFSPHIFHLTSISPIIQHHTPLHEQPPPSSPLPPPLFSPHIFQLTSISSLLPTSFLFSYLPFNFPFPRHPTPPLHEQTPPRSPSHLFSASSCTTTCCRTMRPRPAIFMRCAI